MILFFGGVRNFDYFDPFSWKNFILRMFCNTAMFCWMRDYDPRCYSGSAQMILSISAFGKAFDQSIGFSGRRFGFEMCLCSNMILLPLDLKSFSGVFTGALQRGCLLGIPQTACPHSGVLKVGVKASA